MAAGPEALLVKKIRTAIERRWPEAMIWKSHGSQFAVAGMPDLFVLLRGHLVCLEIKAPRENESDASVLSRVTPLQLQRLKELRNAGACAEACWDVEQALEIVHRYVPDSTKYEEWSRDVRLHALAAAENKLRASNEALEEEIQALRLENDRLRSSK